MALESPRIPPVPREEWTEQTREVFAIVNGEEARINGSPYNTILVMANHAELAAKYLPFSGQLLGKSSLPPRTREIIVLRVARLCHSRYVQMQHWPYARNAGLSTEEIDAIESDPHTRAWSELDENTWRAVDESKADSKISDPVWAVLARHFNRNQLLELVFTIGNYIMYCIYMNNAEAEIEDFTLAAYRK